VIFVGVHIPPATKKTGNNSYGLLGYGNTLSGRWLPIFDGMLVNGATTEYSKLHMGCS